MNMLKSLFEAKCTYESIGKYVRLFREVVNMGLSEASQLSGITVEQIKAWEGGDILEQDLQKGSVLRDYYKSLFKQYNADCDEEDEK